MTTPQQSAASAAAKRKADEEKKRRAEAARKEALNRQAKPPAYAQSKPKLERVKDDEARRFTPTMKSVKPPNDSINRQVKPPAYAQQGNKVFIPTWRATQFGTDKPEKRESVNRQASAPGYAQPGWRSPSNPVAGPFGDRESLDSSTSLSSGLQVGMSTPRVDNGATGIQAPSAPSPTATTTIKPWRPPSWNESLDQRAGAFGGQREVKPPEDINRQAGLPSYAQPPAGVIQANPSLWRTAANAIGAGAGIVGDRLTNPEVLDKSANVVRNVSSLFSPLLGNYSDPSMLNPSNWNPATWTESPEEKQKRLSEQPAAVVNQAWLAEANKDNPAGFDRWDPWRALNQARADVDTNISRPIQTEAIPGSGLLFGDNVSAGQLLQAGAGAIKDRLTNFTSDVKEKGVVGAIFNPQDFINRFSSNINQSIAVRQQVEALPKEQQSAGKFALYNAVSGPQAMQATLSGIADKPARIAAMEAQARRLQSSGDVLEAAKVGAEIAKLKSKSALDVLNENQDPVMELAAGVLLDPTNLIPFESAFDALKAAKRGATYAIDAAKGVSNLDTAIASADKILKGVTANATPGAYDLVDAAGKAVAPTGGVTPGVVNDIRKWYEKYLPFNRTAQTRALQSTNTLWQTATQLLGKVTNKDDARRLISAWVDNPQALITQGLETAAGNITPGAGSIANKYVTDQMPILKTVGEKLKGLASLSGDGDYIAADVASELEKVFYDGARSLFGLAPMELPAGATTFRLVKDGALGKIQYLDSAGKIVKETSDVFANAQATYKAMKSATTQAQQAGLLKGVDFINTLQKNIMNDMFLSRPGYMVKNAASAMAGLIPDGNYSIKTTPEIAGWWSKKLGEFGMNTRTQAEMYGDRTLTNWTRKFWPKFNPYASTIEGLQNLPRTLTKLLGGGVPLAEDKLYLNAADVAGQRAFRQHWTDTLETVFKPALQQLGIGDDVADHMVKSMLAAGVDGSQQNVLRVAQEVASGKTLQFTLEHLGIPAETLSLDGWRKINELFTSAVPEQAGEAAKALGDIFQNEAGRYAKTLLDDPPMPVQYEWTNAALQQDGAEILDTVTEAAKRAGVDPAAAAEQAKGVTQQFTQAIEQGWESFRNELAQAPNGNPDVAIDLWVRYKAELDKAREAVDKLARTAIKAPSKEARVAAWTEHQSAVPQIWQETSQRITKLFEEGRAALIQGGEYKPQNSWLDIVKRFVDYDEAGIAASRAKGANLTTAGGGAFREVMGAGRQFVDKSVSELFEAYKRAPSMENYDLMVDAMRKFEVYGQQVKQYLQPFKEAAQLKNTDAAWKKYFTMRNSAWMQAFDNAVMFNNVNKRIMVANGVGAQVASGLQWTDEFDGSVYKLLGKGEEKIVGNKKEVMWSVMDVASDEIRQVAAKDVPANILDDFQRVTSNMEGVVDEVLQDIAKGDPALKSTYKESLVSVKGLEAAMKPQEDDWHRLTTFTLQSAASRYAERGALPGYAQKLYGQTIAGKEIKNDADLIALLEQYNGSKRQWETLAKEAESYRGQFLGSMTNAPTTEAAKVGDVVWRSPAGDKVVKVTPIDEVDGVMRYAIEGSGQTVPESELYEYVQGLKLRSIADGNAMAAAEDVVGNAPDQIAAAKEALSTMRTEWDKIARANKGYLKLENAVGLYVKDGVARVPENKFEDLYGVTVAGRKIENSADVEAILEEYAGLQRQAKGQQSAFEAAQEEYKRAQNALQVFREQNPYTVNPDNPLDLHGAGANTNLYEQVAKDTAESLRTGGVGTLPYSHMSTYQIEQLRKAEKLVMEKLPQLLGGLPNQLAPAQSVALMDKIRELLPNFDNAVAMATRAGEEAANFAMLNMADRRNIDQVLAMLGPYHYYFSRTPKNWLIRTMQHPNIARMWYQSQRAIGQENQEANLPTRMQGSVPNPLASYGVGPERIQNPVNFLLPYAQVFPTGNEYDDDAPTTFEKYARPVMSQMYPVWQIAIDAGLDKVSPLPNGQKRTSEYEAGDYAPLYRIAGSVYQAMTGQNLGQGFYAADDKWSPYRTSRQVATIAEQGGIAKITGSQDAEQNAVIGKFADQIALNQRNGKPLNEGIPPEFFNQANQVYTEASKQVGYDNARSQIMSWLTGVGGHDVQAGEQALRDQSALYNQLGYSAENPYGSKEAKREFIDQATNLPLWWTKSATIPGADGATPAGSAQFDRLSGEKTKLYSDMNTAVQTYLRSHPEAGSDEIRDIKQPFYDQIGNLEAKYPGAAAPEGKGGDPTKGMNPAEVARYMEQQVIKSSETNKPEYPQNGTPEQLRAYYEALNTFTPEQRKQVDQRLNDLLGMGEADYPGISKWKSELAKLISGQYSSEVIRADGLRNVSAEEKDWADRMAIVRELNDVDRKQAAERVSKILGAGTAKLLEEYLLAEKGSADRQKLKEAHPELGIAMMIAYSPDEYEAARKQFGGNIWNEYYAKDKPKHPGDGASKADLDAYYAQLDAYNAKHPQAQEFGLWLNGRRRADQLAEGESYYSFGQDWTEAKRIFGDDIFEVEKNFPSGADGKTVGKYLSAHPELSGYWQWKKELIDHPERAPQRATDAPISSEALRLQYGSQARPLGSGAQPIGGATAVAWGGLLGSQPSMATPPGQFGPGTIPATQSAPLPGQQQALPLGRMGEWTGQANTTAGAPKYDPLASAPPGGSRTRIAVPGAPAPAEALAGAPKTALEYARTSDKFVQAEQRNAEFAARDAAATKQFGAEAYALYQQYSDLPEGSEERKAFMAAHPELRSISAWLYGRSNGKDPNAPPEFNNGADYEEAKKLFGDGIWDLFGQYNSEWSKAQKKAFFNAHPEYSQFIDWWYGDDGKGDYTKRSHVRTGRSGEKHGGGRRSYGKGGGYGGGGYYTNSGGYDNGNGAYIPRVDPRYMDRDLEVGIPQSRPWRPENINFGWMSGGQELRPEKLKPWRSPGKP